MAVSARGPTGGRVLPVDALLAAYNVVMSGVWLGAASRSWLAPWMAAAHAAAALLPLAWVSRSAPSARRLPGLREAYPLLGLAAFWSELKWLHAVRPGVTHDALVGGWDRGLFGLHLHEVWRPAMPASWFSETMYFSYFVYYVLIALPPIAVALAGRREAFRDMVLRLMTTYLTCYLFYVAFPVLGPRFVGTGGATGAAGFFQMLVARAQAAGDSPGTAFPSSHAAGATTMAWLGCRWLRGPAAALLVVQGVMVLLATVYTQNHFAVDALVGALWALLVQALAVPALLRGVGRIGEPAAVSLTDGMPGRAIGPGAA